jgi:predicted Zn-dependent protease
MPVLSATLAEAQAQLAGQPDPAHHLAYAIVETSTLTVQGTHGAHAGTLRSFDRTLDVDLRVGTPTLDSTHKIRDAGFFSEDRRPAWTVVFEGPASALRLALLRATDDVFRIQRARLTKVRANESVKVAREDESADWSAAPPLTRAVEVLPPAVDVAAWQEIVADVSAIYLSFPEVYDSAVQLTVTTTRRWLVSADGSTGPANIVVADGDNHLRIATWGETVADDGMDLSVYDYTDVARADHLPSRPQIDAMARGVAERVTALRHAPTVDPWSGPAILRGRAAGVFFHEIFGHRIEGQRQKDEDEGQTFTKKVNEPVLPAFLSVIDDPTQATRAGEDLNGHYAVDDEGVAAERVTLVDKGVLKGFLMSRSPIEGFSRSNGHGRRQPGNAVVARQGNLMVDAATSVPYPELRRQLVDLAKKQKRTFGLVFDDISGGFTFTGRSTPNSFVVEPVTVWKVYTDGRPDELVRGVDLIGTPLTTFARIVAAADDVAVFNGVCGAESGWVPVSASAPSLLVSEVEVQRREKGNDRPPILPPIVGAGK